LAALPGPLIGTGYAWWPRTADALFGDYNPLMPFPTAVIFLLVLFTTGMAALCVTGGLCLFAVRGVTGLRQIERSS